MCGGKLPLFKSKKRKEVFVFICKNPKCECDNCTCDPCECSPDNHCSEDCQ